MKAIATTILATSIACSVTLTAQTGVQERPRFALATVKPNTSDDPLMIERRGNRLFASNAPLAWLVKWAFDLDDDRVIGIPGAADNARFDIVAEAPEDNPARGRMQLLMQTLLMERFQLVTHRDSRTLTVYALLPDRTLRVRVTPDDGKPAPTNPFSMSGAGRLTGTRVTAAMLAKVLTDQWHRPVNDETGISGFFDVALEWAPDAAGSDVPDPSRPSLFTAIREQLGFRLETRRTAVDVLVVDRLVVTPSDN
jgi:uncharacterized protein (TIGR03435 family)